MNTTISPATPLGRARPGGTASSDVTDADIWILMTSLVLDHRGAWRSRVSEETGLPFSRFRALRPLEQSPLPARDLAQLLDIDAAATSVIVADLDERGLVRREQDPGDARRKIITITDAGRAVLDHVRRMGGAPSFSLVLDPAEMAELHRMLGVAVDARVQDASQARGRA